MTYDPYGQPESYPPHQYPGQHPQYPPPQYPPGQYGQPGPEDPTAPVIPSQGSGAPYGGGQYGGPPQYGGGQYGGAPAASPTWPPPVVAGPPTAPPPRRRTGVVIGFVAGGVVLVLCLVGLGIVGIRTLSESNGGTTDDPIAQGGDTVGDGGDPYAGTPAADFAEGADGIQLPEAQAVGDFTADQVADTLDRVEEALIATRLDSTMLVDQDPEPFIALMSEDNQPGLRDEFEGGNFGYFASQLADGAALAVPTPRVDGEIAFEATTDDSGYRVIEVVTSFVWAYAFEVPADDPDLHGIVVVRDELVWQVAHADDVADSSEGLWLWNGEAYAWGIECDAFDESLLSPQTELQFDFFGDSTDEEDVFDPQGTLNLGNTC
jgi:hypothetical protein